MTRLNFTDLEVGDRIPQVHKAPITRAALALFAGASGDHNPIHIDSDYAKAAGMPDVFAHGMLSMAYLGQLLTNWVPQSAIRSFGVRFSAITHVGDALTCRGIVSRKLEQNGERLVLLDIEAIDQHGERKLKGEAVIAVT